MIPDWFGGRPMTFIRYEFTDVIENVDYNSYMDRRGRYWFAPNRWALTRMRMRGECILNALQKVPPEYTEMAFCTVVNTDGSSYRTFLPVDALGLKSALGAIDELLGTGIVSEDDLD